MLAIPPFNYPVNLAVSKLAPALMAGNAVVLKPPTQGAVAGIHMMQVGFSSWGSIAGQHGHGVTDMSGWGQRASGWPEA